MYASNMTTGQRLGMCSDHTALKEQGMTQTSQVFQKYMDKTKPIEYTSHVPRRVRIELTSKLREDILPALLEKITSFSQMVDLTMPEEIFEFKFEPVLGILKDMDKLCVDLVNLMTSVRNQYKLEYTWYPRFLKKPTQPSTEPMEEFSYLTWIVLLSNVNRCIMTIISAVTDKDRYRNPSTKEWFNMVSATKATISCVLKGLERSDFQIYFDTIRSMAHSVRSRYSHGSIRVEIDMRGHYYDFPPPDCCLEEYDKSCEITSRSTKFIRRLVAILLERFSRYSQNDFHLRNMNVNQLESLIRCTGICLGESEEGDIYFKKQTVDQLNMAQQLEYFDYNSDYSPYALGHKKMGRQAMLGRLDNKLRAIFDIFDQHFVQLSIHHPPSNQGLHNSIEESRKWCVSWKVLYNTAVNDYLEAYKQLYATPLHLARYFNQPKYWGNQLE